MRYDMVCLPTRFLTRALKRPWKFWMKDLSLKYVDRMVLLELQLSHSWNRDWDYWMELSHRTHTVFIVQNPSCIVYTLSIKSVTPNIMHVYINFVCFLGLPNRYYILIFNWSSFVDSPQIALSLYIHAHYFTHIFILFVNVPMARVCPHFQKYYWLLYMW